MKTRITIYSLDKKSSASFDMGELVSYVRENEEFMHNKEHDGWAYSDTEMFPIIGPTQANNYTVSTPLGECKQDQHGLLREMTYKLESQTAQSVTYSKKYTAGSIILNSKYPKRSTQKELFWNYDFLFTKTFEITNDALLVHFQFECASGMPYMLGYHPAFVLSGYGNEYFEWKGGSVTLSEIMYGGNTAYPVLNQQEILLIKDSGFYVKLKTTGFTNFMLWSPAPNMVCIEPITQYPDASQINSQQNMKLSCGKESFSVEISAAI